MSNTFSAPERAAFKKLLDVAHASQPELGAAIGRLENGGTALSRSYVSQVLGGGRGSDNLDVAERFRRGALGLIEAFLKKSGPLTARSVQDFLHDLRRELSDEELADDMVKALLTRLASLSPEPPKSAYDSTTALPDDARDLVETAALRAAVAHATSQPYFNLHISGPRFSGISTVARAVAAAVKRNSPEALVCYFDCAPDVQQFSAEFVRRLGGAAESPGDDAARIKEFLARLWGELVAGLELPKSALELDLPIPADGFSVPRELLVAVKSRMKGLESAPFRQRVVILDSNDPTDVPLA